MKDDVRSVMEGSKFAGFGVLAGRTVWASVAVSEGALYGVWNILVESSFVEI